MTSVMSVAAAGVVAGAARYASSAADVVKAVQPSGNSSNLGGALARETTNRQAYRADLAVFKMADKTVGTLLDVMT